jgi:hypothetical protein
MSSITTSLFTYRNSCESDSKCNGNEKTEIIFKMKNINLRSVSLQRTLTINIKPPEEKLTSNTYIILEEKKQKELQIEIEKEREMEKYQKKPSIINEMKSILRNNKFKSSESLKEVKRKSVKFIDELPVEENEENEHNNENNNKSIEVNKKKINFCDFNSVNDINTFDNKNTSNRKLAEIIYIPSIKDANISINIDNNFNKQINEKKIQIQNIHTNDSKVKIKKKNNLEEDKVTTKCCLIF